MGTIFWIVLGIVPLALVVPLFVWMLYDGFQYFFRLVWYRFRTRVFIGGHKLIWSKITPDSTKIQKYGRNALLSTNSGAALSANRLVAPAGFWKFWPWSTRGSITYMWHRTAEGEIGLYVGITERHYNATTVSALAASLDGDAQRIEHAPEIPTDSIAIADRREPSMNAVGKTELPSVGEVAKAFSQSFARSGDRRSASVIMTLEMSPSLERRHLRGKIVDKSNEDMGIAGNFGGISNLVSVLTSNAMRVSMTATSSEERTASNILNNVSSSMSTMPFSVDSKSFDEVSTSTTTRILGFIIGAIGVISGLTGWLSGQFADSWVWVFPLIAFALGALTIVLLSNLSEGVMKAPIRSFVNMGIMVIPPYIPWSLRYWIDGIKSNVLAPSKGGQATKALHGWPSPNQVLYLHPFGIMEFASFPEQVDSLGVNVTRKSYQSRGVSDGILKSVSDPMFLGVTGTDQPFFVDASTVNFSSYSGGAMGSGKTNLLQVLYTNMVRLSSDRVLDLTPVWMETKGPGADEVWNLIGHLPGCLRVDVFDRNADFRLALEGPRITDQNMTPGKVQSNVRNLVNGFISAWGSGAIAGESKQSLISALTIAMLLTREEIQSLQLDGVLMNPDRPNIPHLAWLIMRGNVYQADIGERLIGIGTEHDNDADASARARVLASEIASFARYISARTWKEHDRLLNPPRNKLKDLMGVDAMWDAHAERKEVYVEQIPAAFRPIIMNFGPPGLAGDKEGQEIDPNIVTLSGDGFNIAEARRMLIVALWLTWNYAKNACVGWEEQNKRLAFFADELSDLVNPNADDSSLDATDEIMKQGRGLGVSLQSGSQYPDQLSHRVRQNALTAHSKLWFKMEGADNINIAVNDLALGDRNSVPYSHENIGNNPIGVAAVRMLVARGVNSGAFTLRVPLATEWAKIVLDRNAIRNRLSIFECAQEFIVQQRTESMERALPPAPEDMPDEEFVPDEVIRHDADDNAYIDLGFDDAPKKRRRRERKRRKQEEEEPSNPYDIF